MTCDRCPAPHVYESPSYAIGEPHRFCAKHLMDHLHGIAIMLDRFRDLVAELTGGAP